MRGFFENKILYVRRDDLADIKEQITLDTHLVEIDGENVNSWTDYIFEIETRFMFPTTCGNNIDKYLDWMRDLDWLKKEKFVIIIYNFSLFIQKNLLLKEQIINHYKDIILPFWETEVIDVVVDGRAKSFIVYLVE